MSEKPKGRERRVYLHVCTPFERPQGSRIYVVTCALIRPPPAPALCRRVSFLCPLSPNPPVYSAMSEHRRESSRLDDANSRDGRAASFA